MQKDIYIDPAYLVTNIEWAFKVWREAASWGKNLPFGQFCEYVLPYRVGNEGGLCHQVKNCITSFMPIIREAYKENDSDIVEAPTYAAHLVLRRLCCVPPFISRARWGPNIRIGPQIAELARKEAAWFVHLDGVHLPGFRHSLRHKCLYAWEQQPPPLLEFHRRPGQ